jgi:hypothetical protein
MNGTIGYTATRSIFIPEVRVTHPQDWFTFEALRGSGHTLAVFNSGICIGWIEKGDLNRSGKVTCQCCGGKIDVIDQDEGRDIWSHVEDTGCDDPCPAY